MIHDPRFVGDGHLDDFLWLALGLDLVGADMVWVGLHSISFSLNICFNMAVVYRSTPK